MKLEEIDEQVEAHRKAFTVGYVTAVSQALTLTQEEGLTGIPLLERLEETQEEVINRLAANFRANLMQEEPTKGKRRKKKAKVDKLDEEALDDFDDDSFDDDDFGEV